MTKVITFASAKGGSGKTTLTATFGSFLAELGYQVLLVDCDEATNGLTLLYIDEVNSYPVTNQKKRTDCYGVFDNKDPKILLTDAVSISSGVFLIPAAFSFENRPQVSPQIFLNNIKEIIKDHSEFDFILLDAQAGADSVSLLAMDKSVSELVIIVSEYDPLSAAGVERLKGLAPESLSFERTWILLNKLLPEFVESFSKFLSVSHYLSPLPWTAEVVRAYAKRTLALDISEGNNFTLAIIQTVRSLPIPELKGRIDEWIKDRASVIRQPIEDQYRDLESMLGSTIQRIYQIKSSKRKKSIFLIGIGLSSVSIILPIYTFFAKDNLINLDLKSDYLTIFAVLLATSTIFLSSIFIEPISYFWRYFLSKLGIDITDIETDLELERIDRQRELYIRKLNDLEFLRSADPESLLEKSFKQNSSFH